MSVMDPLLNLGILWRCLAAYCGIDFKSETEKFKTLLKLNDSLPPAENAKSKPSSPLRASLSKSMSLRAFLSRSINSPAASEQNRASTSPQSNRESSSPDFICSSDEGGDETKLNNSMLKSISYTDFGLKKNSDTNSQKMNEAYRKRLLHLHKVLGDSVFLVEKLRENPITQNEYMSPMLSDRTVLAKFPQTFLIVSTYHFKFLNIF